MRERSSRLVFCANKSQPRLQRADDQSRVTVCDRALTFCHFAQSAAACAEEKRRDGAASSLSASDDSTGGATKRQTRKMPGLQSWSLNMCASNTQPFLVHSNTMKSPSCRKTP